MTWHPQTHEEIADAALDAYAEEAERREQQMRDDLVVARTRVLWLAESLARAQDDLDNLEIQAEEMGIE